MSNEEKILEMLGQLTGEVREMRKDISSLDNRIGSLEKRMDSLEKRMDSLEKRMDSLETRLEETRTEMHERFDKLEPLVKYAWEDIALMEKKINKTMAIHENNFHNIPLPEQYAY